MAYSKDRDTLVYVADLALQAERYDADGAVIRSGYCVIRAGYGGGDDEGGGAGRGADGEGAESAVVGYKNVVGARRAAWRILSSIKQKEKSKGNKVDAKRIKDYRTKVENELTEICAGIILVIDEHLIPSCSPAESTVFYYQLKGDYCRYLTEFKTGIEKKEAADQSLKAYETAWAKAESELDPTHSIRLGLALNISVFYYEIMSSPERACHLGKQALDEASSELAPLSEVSYKDSTLIMQLFVGQPHPLDLRYPQRCAVWIANI